MASADVEGHVEVKEVTPEMDLDWVRHGIAGIAPDLDPGFGEPMSREYAERLASSPFHGQLIAVQNRLASPGTGLDGVDGGRIVGAATLSLIMGAGFAPVYGYDKAQLEDYVVAADQQGRGTGGLLWDGMVSWCQRNGVGQLIFQTEDPDVRTDLPRTGILDFYRRRGAETHEGTVHFEAPIDLGKSES